MLKIVKGIINGDRRSLSRAISIIDNEEDHHQEIIRQIFKKTGKAMTLGLTGSGGAGKSSLIGKLVPEFQELGYKVAIIAVDPTSPITGGAILGDRVRMQSNIIEDSDIFMRSVASRGAVGGISKSLRNIIRILDAAGYTLIIVESVGAGQLEIEVSKVVNLTLVLFTPNTGDKIQAVKAGLTEIGDVYVINKADLDGATSLYLTLKDLIGETERKPTVVKVSSKTGKGVKELAQKIDGLLKDRIKIIQSKEHLMLEIELKDMILNIIQKKIVSMLDDNKSFDNALVMIQNKKIDPFRAAENLSQEILKNQNKFEKIKGIGKI